ncbi:tripartite tricarboxylate transporter permease [Marinomonas aquiplantarum]|uniref:Putative tricarboxylic transport membrane protein n=1 Tax=Marinomonas aquiplantarum TaxID=491951 RepID=A0A366D4L8_9GAMM|nr:tripartite tricarboxylate transporter permease [Marinomonas aquiplantarum]RBO84987.1 putative tricarboxylic transport membrane protein [Marinomonas aquiplantarum]
MELVSYLIEALTPLNLLLALVGVIAGTIIGAMPGLSATMAVAVLVPFTYVMGPASGLIVLGAIYTGAIYGGAFAAILVNTPGTPSAIATTFDGYPLAKQGKGALAISLATLASVGGGLVGGLALLFLAPPLAEVALAFGPSEYFWMAVFGLTLISALSVGNTLKGLIGACIGLLLSAVGVAVVGGDVRFTFDQVSLLGGIDLTSAIIGLYCIPVIIDLVANKAPHLKFESIKGKSSLSEAFGLILKRKFNLLRSSIIGTVVGILPGAGGSIAGLVAYTEARRSSKESETFGKGAPEGIVATESANNATVGGGFIPTLVLGIPGTPPDAIILGALLVQGIKTGPSLFTDQGSIVYTFIYGLIIATLLMLPVGLILGKYAYKSISKTPKELLVPCVAFLTVIGSYAIHSNPHDTFVMFVLGVAAWFLAKLGFSASPIVLGLVLGKIAEQGFVQTYLIGSAQGRTLEMFFGRPISIGIIVCCVIALLFPILAARKQKKREVIEEPSSKPSVLVFVLALVGVGIVLFNDTKNMSILGAVFPSYIAGAMIFLSAVLFIKLAIKKGGFNQNAKLLPNKRQAGVSLVILLWTIFMAKIGFGLAAIIAFISIMFISTFEKPKPMRVVINIIISILIVLLFYFCMKEILLLRLPSGILF